MRHDLGEFYTPDWLAEYMLRETLAKKPTAKLLDPACGSGTFLFLAVRLLTGLLSKRKWSKTRILQHVSQNIVGIDVHPLAVLIARTNFLLAAALLLQAPRKGAFVLPVYLGDSLMYRPFVGPLPLHEAYVPADGKWLVFPASVIGDPALFDQLVARLVQAAAQGPTGRPVFRRYLAALGLPAGDSTRLLSSLQVLTDLFSVKRDSIWRFIIRNLVRPHILARARDFDLVVGNPPWLSLRYIKSADYQSFVKDRMAALKIKPKGAKLVTQLDLAGLFFAESAQQYLRDGGTIAFVMPRSVLGGPHYAEFVKFHFGPFGVRCYRIVDLEGVEPLFNVPACVIAAEKGKATRYPVPVTVLAGRLPRKNASWAEAEKKLSRGKETWRPFQRGTARSYYHDQFRQGATIVPRRLWFVRPVVDPKLGFDASVPLVESDVTVPAKPPWGQIVMRGRIERQFLYASILSSDIVPFHWLRIRPVVLPAELDAQGRPRLLTAATAPGRGHAQLAAWLGQAEGCWAASGKRSERTKTVLQRLDFGHGLSAQFRHHRRYWVLYTASATYLAAAVLDAGGGLVVSAEEGVVPAAGLVVDAKVYWYATDRAEEAFYLCAWLNSPVVDAAIKSRQSRGLFGPRDIHKLPLKLPLPRFNPKDAEHAEMAECAQMAASKAAAIAGVLQGRSVGALRRAIRTHPDVAPPLACIDELARKIGGL